MPEICDFLVDRNDIGCRRWYCTTPNLDLQSGEISIIHERFAFTANNITYAHCGETFGYWDYFPVPKPWGSIPVWGRGRVDRSRCADIAEGERIYGFFPMSNRLLLRPARIKPHRFVDGRPHRASLPRTYNEYIRIDHDPDYDDDLADLHLALLPLFNLSFFLAHFLAEARFSEARTVIVSSASSKAAIGFAFEMRRITPAGLKIVALTSPPKAKFLKDCGYYDRIVAYEGIAAALANCGPSLYVDISGDDRILEAVHHTLRGDLRGSWRAGMARRRPRRDTYDDLPGPKPELFFTPHHILARRECWGPVELRRRLSSEWRAFTAEVRTRLAFVHHEGRDAIEAVYDQVLAGQRPPNCADILSLDGA
jgi:Protein of unknown function (DUF2855)